MKRSPFPPSLAVASEPGPERPDAAHRWARAVALARGTESPERDRVSVAAYGFGEVVVELFSQDESVLRPFSQLYAECAVPPGSTPGHHRLRCFLRPDRGSDLLSATFELPVPLDLVEIVLAVLQTRRDAYYVARDLTGTGWRQVTSVARPAVPLVAINGSHVLFDAAELWPAFLRDLLVGAALTSQKEILFFHAASVSVGGRGVLFIGRGGTGKTTLALALAARGHGVLGDDYTALRPGNLTLLPFRRNVHIRPGPRAQGVQEALQRGRYEIEVFSDGQSRLNATVQDLFPEAPAPHVRLAAAFFLRRFGPEPGLAPFRPSLEQLEWLKPLAFSGPIRASWGISPGRRILGFLRVIDILSKIRCYSLDVGPPDETAARVERALEDV
jgi:hypothetical protein